MCDLIISVSVNVEQYPGTGCIWSPKVDSSSCVPSGPTAPNGKCGRHPEAETSRITRLEVLQGALPGIYQLLQPHTIGTH